MSSGHADGQWRSLDELADTDAFRAWVEDEFPERASLLSMDRRKFMQVMGASVALAGLTGCRYLPQRRAVPQVVAVEDVVPGKPLFYATSVVLSGIGTGVLARSNDGRPTKLEGAPAHPGSLGATDANTQAAVLDLYDPERTRNVTRLGKISAWDAFLAELREALATERKRGGSGVRIVTGAATSPTMGAVMERFLGDLPQAKWVQWEPVHRDNVLAGMKQAFGRPLTPVYRFDRADVVLTLDADPVNQLPGHVRYARDIMSRRRVRRDGPGMSRLYAVESVPTNMGATADHRLPVRARDVMAVALELARHLGIGAAASSGNAADAASRWIAACADDLKQHRGRAVVVVGDHQPAALHALVATINDALGATGEAVYYAEPVYARGPAGSDASIADLVRDMRAGVVRALVMLGVNPVYDAPADLEFGDAVRGVALTVHGGLCPNETSSLCRWHVPEAHSLEAWGDCRAYDGTASVIQPLIHPIYDAKSAVEIVAALSGRPAEGYELVRAQWRTMIGDANFDTRWRRIIHDGVAPGTAFPPVDVGSLHSLRPARFPPLASPPDDRLELVFAADPTLWDGRFASNGWLQELPKPLTRLTWDNAALIGPSTARKLGLADGAEVELSLGGRKLLAPVRVQPGHPSGSVTLHLGHGRTKAGAVGTGVGSSAYVLRSQDAMWFASGLEIRRTGRTHTFARTEQHHAITDGRLQGTQGRDIVRVLQYAGGMAGDDGTDGTDGTNGAPALRTGAKHGDHSQDHPSLYDAAEHRYDGHRWGMSIDLTLCTGCNACVAACQAENNIPVVGKEQVTRGREMHWIRIDRYFEGDADDPAVHHQPVLCMHCENAPCEPVCPVAATVHSREGLNQMVYNRCVGTRYCSNNCPYKVRRFNFLNYANHDDVPITQLLQNPNVTVRGRGVMEKCTFCVQRIGAARIESKKQGRPIKDGEIVTACQAACPPQAIVFGDIGDPASAVSRAKLDPRDYSLLEEVNTKPRLTYLAKVTNKNPRMERSGRGARGEK